MGSEGVKGIKQKRPMGKRAEEETLRISLLEFAPQEFALLELPSIESFNKLGTTAQKMQKLTSSLTLFRKRACMWL